MPKANKQRSTEKVLALGSVVKCRKHAIKNIVFPMWDDLGLYGQIFRQFIRTKEMPDGNLYDETKFRVVLRVVGGKVLMSGRPDSYCWPADKLQATKDVGVIGVNSAKGILSLCEILSSVTDTDEKLLLADMFACQRKDFLLVGTPEEERECIMVTADLYEQGITHCVDEWAEPDENGEASVTHLNIGDVLIVTSAGVYCVRHEEFFETHAICPE